ncbi:hypothetical protein [Flavobacterium album]|nr:hypothetical protein [Flavobacterium album]
MKHYENVAAGIIGEFPDGDYAIEYKTIFGVRSEQFKLKFEKDRSNLHELKLCVDDLSPELRAKTSALFIDLLKDDEEIVIDYSFSGCFASGKESMIIKKHRGIYYILYKETKRKLLDKEVSALRDMELELRNLRKADYGCTTNSKTTVTYKSASISFSEPCGYWEGYYRIKGILELE